MPYLFIGNHSSSLYLNYITVCFIAVTTSAFRCWMYKFTGSLRTMIPRFETLNNKNWILRSSSREEGEWYVCYTLFVLRRVHYRLSVTLCRPSSSRELQILQLSSQKIVFRDLFKILFQTEYEEDLNECRKRYRAGSVLKGAQGLPADARPVGKQLRSDIPSEPGKTDPLPKVDEDSFHSWKQYRCSFSHYIQYIMHIMANMSNIFVVIGARSLL